MAWRNVFEKDISTQNLAEARLYSTLLHNFPTLKSTAAKLQNGTVVTRVAEAAVAAADSVVVAVAVAAAAAAVVVVVVVVAEVVVVVVVEVVVVVAVVVVVVVVVVVGVVVVRAVGVVVVVLLLRLLLLLLLLLLRLLLEERLQPLDRCCRGSRLSFRCDMMLDCRHEVALNDSPQERANTEWQPLPSRSHSQTNMSPVPNWSMEMPQPWHWSSTS